MPAVTRVVVTGLLTTLIIAGASSLLMHAEVREAIPAALLRDWSWRNVGPFDGTGQFVSVTTDNAFPYRICGTAADGRAACGASRDDSGWITARNWEWLGFAGDTPIVLDPVDADVAYGGVLQRFDRRTTQLQDVTPAPSDGETPARRGLLLFSPTDPRTLYYATSLIRKTNNSGVNWTAISPDLSRAPSAPNTAPASASISALAASTVDGRVMWAGTTQGSLHVTRDSGTTWSDVTPTGISTSAGIARIEASRFDPNTVYIVINSDDRAAGPGAMRTRDGGRTWMDIGRLIPEGARVNVVREDPFRRGLLFAGTSQAVALSIDDGDTWQPLALNLPATAVSDLVIKDADLIAATAGRAFWVLNDISPLRQLTADIARADAFLFRPAVAWRERSRTSMSAAAPDAGPAVRNSPAGASFNYLIGPGTSGPVSLEIVETISANVIRRFSSEGPEPTMTSAPGLHRLTWDLRSAPVRGHGVLVQAGTYQVRLSAGGRVVRQAVIVRMDPRVRTSALDLDAQATLSKRVYAKLREITDARSAGGTADASAALDRASAALVDALDSLQQSDTRPTPALTTLATAAIDHASALLASPQP